MIEKAEKPRFILKIGEIYKTPDDGLRAVKEALKDCEKVRLTNLPVFLIKELLPLVGESCQKQVYLHDESFRALIDSKGAEVEKVNSTWTQNFFGETVNMGEINTPRAMFHILWKDDEIKRIFANTDPKCIECAWKKNFVMRMDGVQSYASLYDREEGVQSIIKKAEKSSVFRACIVPPFILRALIPFAFKGDYRFILSRRDALQQHFPNNFDVRIGSEAKIFFVYGGEEATVGSLRLDNDMYSIFWRGDEIFSIMKFENLICSNCIFRVFDTAWKYSKIVGSAEG
jgi:hypothetical protein